MSAIVKACNNNQLDDMAAFQNMMIGEPMYRMKKIRQSSKCTMPDGTTRTYDKTGIWAGVSYPDCNLSIRFAVFTSLSQTAMVYNRSQVVSNLPLTDAKALNNGKPLVVLSIGAEVNTASIKIETLIKWLLNAGFNVLQPIFDTTSAGQDYMAAVADSRLVADVLALFLKSLVRQKVIAASSTVFIGHSVGAQMGWMAASQFADLRGFIGLDPTGVFFDCRSELGLSKSVASFVQVVHTDYQADTRYGTRVDRGHIDYYANYQTETQPGCPAFTNPLTSTNKDPRYLACSHFRAFDIFYQAMDPSKTCQFAAQQIMGDYAAEEPASMTILTPDSLKSLTSATFELPSTMGRFSVQTSADAANLCV